VTGTAAAAGTSAGFGRRLAALIYDALLLAALLLTFTAFALMLSPGHRAILPENVGAWAYLYQAALLALACAYFVFNWVLSGQTLGMRAWRLYALSPGGKPLDFAHALLRSACAVLAWAPAALGVLWLYVDTEHLALHDRLSRTRMIHLERVKQAA
jgi:uncharacterized RDD family membrane protein YckC